MSGMNVSSMKIGFGLDDRPNPQVAKLASNIRCSQVRRGSYQTESERAAAWEQANLNSAGREVPRSGIQPCEPTDAWDQTYLR